MSASFSVSGMISMSRLHVYIDPILDPSRRLIEISFIAGCKLFTGVPSRKKCPIYPASTIASLFFIFMINVEYSVSILLGIWLLMIVVFSSSSLSSAVDSRENLLLVLCWVGYNESTEFSSKIFNLFYLILILLPLTIILATVAVVAGASRYPVCSSPSSLYRVVVLRSIPSQTWNHLEGFCVAV